MKKVDKSNRPFVFVRCLTYNHENYIEDALKGFAMQKTDFPFLAVVIDDCSTDGTADIIRRYEAQYPDKIKGIYLPHNFHQTREDKCPYYQEYIDKATYWAECEGDDYWTDPLKLQKQVDFLESHPEYDMVCARFDHFLDDSKEMLYLDLYDNIISPEMDGMEIKQEHFVHYAQPSPCTVMYRNGTLLDNDIYPKLKFRFDLPVYYCFLYKHRCWLINEKMAIHILHEGSLTRSGFNEYWNKYLCYVDILQYMPNDDILMKICAVRYRNDYLLANSQKESYSLHVFLNDMKVYLTHKPSYRNIISATIRIILNRLKAK